DHSTLRTPFIEAPGVRNRAERRFARFDQQGGLLPFPRTGCVLHAESILFGEVGAQQALRCVLEKYKLKTEPDGTDCRLLASTDHVAKETAPFSNSPFFRPILRQGLDIRGFRSSGERHSNGKHARSTGPDVGVLVAVLALLLCLLLHDRHGLS